jgi:putative transcriptional regulator
MLRFKIKELLARKEFDEGRRITLTEVAEHAGIHRMTLSKIINQKGYSTVTDNLDKLCEYFQCRIEDLVEYIPNKPETHDKHSEEDA